MAKKIIEAKSKQRTKVKQLSNPKVKLTSKQARKVKGGAETTQGVTGGTDSIWIDLGYPTRKK